MIYVLFAILSGVTNVVSRSVNFVLSDKIGMYQSTFFNYVFGLAGSLLILLVFYDILYIIQKEVEKMNYFVSVFTGVILAIMVSLNGGVSNAAGNYASSVIIHFIGLIGIIFVLIFTKSKIKNLKGIPFYMFSGGLIGVLTVLFTNASSGVLGVSLTVSLTLLGQLVTSLVIDNFGYFNMPVVKFDKRKILGLVIIITGIYVMTLA